MPNPSTSSGAAAALAVATTQTAAVAADQQHSGGTAAAAAGQQPAVVEPQMQDVDQSSSPQLGSESACQQMEEQDDWWQHQPTGQLDAAAGDQLSSAANGSRPLFFARFSAGWVHASLGTLAASILERERRYAEAVQLLQLLLGGNACLSKRGGWWTRLSINLEHLKQVGRQAPLRLLHHTTASFTLRSCFLRRVSALRWSLKYDDAISQTLRHPAAGRRGTRDGRSGARRLVRSPWGPSGASATGAAPGQAATALEATGLGRSGAGGAQGGAHHGAAPRRQPWSPQQVSLREAPPGCGGV